MDTLREARDTAADRAEETNLGFAVVKSPDAKRFDYLFPQLQENPDDLLPVTPDTVRNLIELGQEMRDTGGDDSGDAEISAAYTYFGQFVDHDITLGTTSSSAQNLLSPDLTPLELEEIRETTKNIRTATFELDSVYNHPAPRDPENRSKMRIGRVAQLEEERKPFLRPDDKADENDLPRRRRRFDPKKDRAALIGDARNDENTIIAQLHLAFLLAHNKLVDQGETYEDARKLLTQHYQYIVVHDFLRQVADPQIVDDILENGPRFYDPGEGNDFFLPMEFSVAAYRFGHSMVRAEYDFNLNFNTSGDEGTTPATLGFLFTFSALSGQLGFGQGFDTLPENWIIEWENFFDPQGGAPRSKARRFDTKLVEPLQELRDELGNPLKDCARDTEAGEISASLAVRNLLRGYLLRMPTGQAVARALGEEVLTEDEITAGAASPEQVRALVQGGFLDHTPLWYYILVESAVRADGQHLGPVGSRLIAEVIIGLVQRSPNSILRQENWKPSLDRKEEDTFTLPDLLRFAGVLS
jgi:hypothetical protein